MKHNFNRSKTAVALYVEDNEQKTCFTTVSLKSKMNLSWLDKTLAIRTSEVEHQQYGSHYETWYEFDKENTEKFVSFFGGAENFLKNLKKKYSGPYSCSEIIKFADRNGIKYEESDMTDGDFRYEFGPIYFPDIRLYDENKNFLIPYVYTPPKKGKAKIYDENGKITLEMQYKDGKLDGLTRSYFSTGDTYWEENYTKGELNGKTVRYYENGNIKQSDVFVNGIKEGPDQSFDKEGHLIEEVMWADNRENGPARLFYPDGSIRFETSAIEGKQNGSSKGYYETGELQFEAVFKDDKIVGESKEYYINGNIYSIVPWKDGKANGTARFYYESGRLMWIIQYKDGVPDGDSVMFSPEGRVKVKNSWKSGRLNGTKCTFADDGSLELSISYTDGKPENIPEHSRFKPHIRAWEKITSEPSLRSGIFAEEKKYYNSNMGIHKKC